MICHTHTDAGWAETYDSYYHKVDRILEQVVKQLKKDTSLKFNWADTSFLAKWYRETDSENRDKIHEVVESGQFNFMGSSWVMNDETLLEYKDMLLQYKVGLNWVEDTFGVKPRVAWHIDPFGASAVTPGLLADLGYEAIVLSRIGTTLYDELEDSSSTEFLWSAAPFNGQPQEILAHALVNS